MVEWSTVSGTGGIDSLTVVMDRVAVAIIESGWKGIEQRDKEILVRGVQRVRYIYKETLSSSLSRVTERKEKS
jgi:hypothetical protein